MNKGLPQNEAAPAFLRDYKLLLSCIEKNNVDYKQIR